MKRSILKIICISCCINISCKTITNNPNSGYKNNTNNKLECAFGAMGLEEGMYLSHAFGKIYLQNGINGQGELFIIEHLSNGRVALAACGKEKGKYLSHAYKKVWLQTGIRGQGEEWKLINRWNGSFTLQCYGEEQDLYLSHSNSKIYLKDTYEGEGELWIKKCN